MPSLIFKKFCADQQKLITNQYNKSYFARVQFPSVFREMKADSKKNADDFASLMDLGSKGKKHFSKEEPDHERYGVGRNSVIQTCLRKKDMMLDILPSVYLMLHPAVRECNIQLFNP